MSSISETVNSMVKASVKATIKCRIIKGMGYNSKIKLFNNYTRRRLTLINADATLNQC